MAFLAEVGEAVEDLDLAAVDQARPARGHSRRPNALGHRRTPLDRGEDDRIEPVDLDAQEYRGETWIGYDVFEDNIEGEGIQGLWLDHLARRVGVDVANAAINGDTNLANVGQENKLLRKQDGWMKLASTHVVDADGQNVSEDVLGDAVEAMPAKYMTADVSAMRLFVQYKLGLNWRRQVARRGTAVGDAALVNSGIPDYAGIPIVGDNVIKTSNNLTKGLFCNPKNALIGFWRDIKIEMFKDITIQSYKVVISCRFAVNYFNPDAVVRVDNVRPMR